MTFINENAETAQEAAAFFRDWSIRFACYSVVWNKEVETVFVDDGFAYLTNFITNGNLYNAIYVPFSQRNRGVYEKVVALQKHPVLILGGDDEIILAKKTGHPYAVAFQTFWDSFEYKLVFDFYQRKTARRSGVPLMRHIDEGVYVLRCTTDDAPHHLALWDSQDQQHHHSPATTPAVLGYILHPLVQEDTTLSNNFRDIVSKGQRINTEALLLAIEYRGRANAYLSTHDPAHNRPDPGPLSEVSAMLVADKVQNRKDFEIYHEGTHPRSDRLAQYFKEWLNALNVDEQWYQKRKNELVNLHNLNTVGFK